MVIIGCLSVPTVVTMSVQGLCILLAKLALSKVLRTTLCNLDRVELPLTGIPLVSVLVRVCVVLFRKCRGLLIVNMCIR